MTISRIQCVETLTRMHLVMEYAGGGELYNYVHEKGKLTEEDTKNIFTQVVSAVAHMVCPLPPSDIAPSSAQSPYCPPGYQGGEHPLHGAGQSQGSLFPSTLTRYNFQLGDFGFSCFVEPIEQLTTFCGSPPYAAPELLKWVEQGRYKSLEQLY